MFNSNIYKSIYKRFMGPLAEPCILLVNTGTDFTPYNSKAHFSKYKETDLIAGGSIQLGDVRMIILAEDMPSGVTELGLKDRVAIDNRQYSIVHWDAYSRTIGSTDIAIEATIRGGGVYQP